MEDDRGGGAAPGLAAAAVGVEGKAAWKMTGGVAAPALAAAVVVDDGGQHQCWPRRRWKMVG